MADKTGIEWTDATWNPVVGCTIVSPGCKNCYAMAQAARIIRMAEGAGKATHYAGTVEAVKGKPVWTGTMALAPDSILTQPLRWKKPRRIFVNSMGDLFHEDVPDEWIDRVFAVMALAPQHTFQILTKRSARMRAYLTQARSVERADVRNRLKWETTIEVINLWHADWKHEDITGAHRSRAIGAFANWPLRNVWLGVSAEDQARANERIPDLLATPAAVRFVSAEPLLGPIDFRHLVVDHPSYQGVRAGLDALAGQLFDLGGTPIDDPAKPIAKLNQIIVGGECGPKARPMHPAWPRDILAQGTAAGTAFFFKQWGDWHPFAPDHLRMHPVRTAMLSVPREDWDGCTWRVGKKRAGRLLDGVEHNGMPEVRS